MLSIMRSLVVMTSNGSLGFGIPDLSNFESVTSGFLFSRCELVLCLPGCVEFLTVVTASSFTSPQVEFGLIIMSLAFVVMMGVITELELIITDFFMGWRFFNFWLGFGIPDLSNFESVTSGLLFSRCELVLCLPGCVEFLTVV